MLHSNTNPNVAVRGAFPMNGNTGTRTTSVVYFELEPGRELGMHTDSAEEILVIMGGEVEATVGDDRGRASEGDIVLIPEMVPHNVRNVGSETARVCGVFSSNYVVSTFEHAFEPGGQNVFDTREMVAA
jgi:quercetin dioxygenase-like cupin family protein